MNSLTNLQICSSLANYDVNFSTVNDLTDWCPEADIFLVDTFFKTNLPLIKDVQVIWIDAT